MKEKVKQTMGGLRKPVRAAGVGLSTLAASFFMSAPAYAAGVEDSQIVTGTEQLIGDLTTWLMVLAPVVSGLLIITSASGAAWLTRWIRRNGTTALWWRWCPASAPF